MPPQQATVHSIAIIAIPENHGEHVCPICQADKQPHVCRREVMISCLLIWYPRGFDGRCSQLNNKKKGKQPRKRNPTTTPGHIGCRSRLGRTARGGDQSVWQRRRSGRGGGGACANCSGLLGSLEPCGHPRNTAHRSNLPASFSSLHRCKTRSILASRPPIVNNHSRFSRSSTPSRVLRLPKHLECLHSALVCL